MAGDEGCGRTKQVQAPAWRAAAAGAVAAPAAATTAGGHCPLAETGAERSDRRGKIGCACEREATPPRTHAHPPTPHTPSLPTLSALTGHNMSCLCSDQARGEAWRAKCDGGARSEARQAHSCPIGGTCARRRGGRGVRMPKRGTLASSSEAARGARGGARGQCAGASPQPRGTPCRVFGATARDAGGAACRTLGRPARAA